MISLEELAICRRRGHAEAATPRGWSQCKWCGMWQREKRSVEEREDEPPEEELDIFISLKRSQESLNRFPGADEKRSGGDAANQNDSL